VDLSEDEVARLSGAWFAAFPEMRAFLADEREALWGRVAATLALIQLTRRGLRSVAGGN